MAVLQGGILGKSTGKIGNIITSNWKDRNVAKSFTPPSNPDTEAQQEQRGKFGACVNFAKLILASVIQPFWDLYAVGMSGFNLFTRVNIESFADPITYSTVKVTQGQLEGSNITEALYAAADVTITFPTATQGNGLATDKVVGVVVDTVNNIAFVKNVGTLRSAAAIVVTVGADRTAEDMQAYLFFFRGAGKSLIVSTSSNIAVNS